MPRTRYLCIVGPLLILLFILPDISVRWMDEIRLTIQVTGGIALWFCVFMRFLYLGFRKELSVLPSVPFLYLPLYRSVMEKISPGQTPGTIHLIIVGLAFLAGAIVMMMSFVPDKYEASSRRLDSLTIVLSVFVGYFVITECIALIILAQG
ncbi:MAG: hypothetical protein RR250_03180 [Akkermansia sp.]